jgi:hypothetical protein
MSQVPNVNAASTRTTGQPEWMDVWSRSGSKYRIRAVVLMLANMLLFAGVGSFAFWLRSGDVFAPARAGYADLLWHTFQGVGEAEVSLGSLLIEPISIQDVPIQIPIVGLLIAALISMPILVAILYRFWSSLPLIAVVGFLAVMPWLAVTLLGSCILASVKPFRTRFRFMSALIGLVPAIVYLSLAWAGTTDAVVGRIDPVDRIKFVAPWVLAVVASAVVFAVVLAIAKMVNYRPGAVTPLLAMMFILPVALFEFNVGRDELYYRLLERRDQAYFTEVNASTPWELAALRAWQQHPLPRPSWEAVRQVEEEKWLFELTTDIGPRQSELTRHQVDLAQGCDEFHRFFPDSRYTPNALYLKARALDRRVDVGEFRASRWIRFYEEFPSVASRDIWRLLLANRPDTGIGAVAALRSAQLEAREGEIDHALEKLEKLIARFDVRTWQAATMPAVEVVAGLVDDRAERSLRIGMEQVLLEAHRLRDLLLANRDPLYEYDPLSGSQRPGDAFRMGLLDLDPRHEMYLENLEALKVQYPHCQIEDNIDLEIAKLAATAGERISKLQALLSQVPDGDAAPEALLRLGLAFAETEDSRRRDESWAELARRHPDSIWVRLARRYAPTVPRVQLSTATTHETR